MCRLLMNRLTRGSKLCATLPVLLLGMAILNLNGVCQGSLLVNGGFEDPALSPGAFITISPGGEPAGFAWEVSSGTVDLAHLPVSPFVEYPAFEGVQALDLNGVGLGALFQDFATIAGETYLLSFAYADNPSEGGISTADIAAGIIQISCHECVSPCL